MRGGAATAGGGAVAGYPIGTQFPDHIRAKIFLRTDLYERAGAASGADFAKLAANRTEISWSDRHLYSMLVRRIANSSAELADYCRAKIEFEADASLGSFPLFKRYQDARPLIDRMVGEYMGANARKGLSFRWLLDHIRDGCGNALPRPLVRLVEQSADEQKGSRSFPRWPRLLEPKSLRRALDRVSDQHVIDSLDEWPWLRGFKSRVELEHQVPWERRTLESLLERTWDDTWSPTVDVRPPADRPRELVDYLVEVGILRTRPDERLDAPDLFLDGLGLRRKGGVGRK